MPYWKLEVRQRWPFSCPAGPCSYRQKCEEEMQAKQAERISQAVQSRAPWVFLAHYSEPNAGACACVRVRVRVRVCVRFL